MTQLLNLVCLSCCTLFCFVGCQNRNEIQSKTVSEAAARVGPHGKISTLVSHGDRDYNEIELNFCGRNVTDKELEHLRGLGGVMGLVFSETRITDQGLVILATLPDLRYLQIADTAISDEGLKSLRNCTKLESLDLRRTKISADAIGILEGFPKLKTVFAKGTPLQQSEKVSIDITSEPEIYLEMQDSGTIGK